MYLYLPCLGLWTSHPFTVAWSSTGSDSSIFAEKRSLSDSFASFIGVSEKTTMSVLIKGQDGFTKKLLRKVEDSADGRIKATALAEGPFGTKDLRCSTYDKWVANVETQVAFILLRPTELCFWLQVESGLLTQCPIYARWSPTLPLERRQHARYISCG